MGFMTEISILNDGWHEAQKDPQKLVDEISLLMNGRPQYRRGSDGSREYLGSAPCGAAQIRNASVRVYQSHHANEPALYLAWQNSFQQLSPWILERELETDPFCDKEYVLDYLDREVKQAEQLLKQTKRWIAEQKKLADEGAQES